LSCWELDVLAEGSFDRNRQPGSEAVDPGGTLRGRRCRPPGAEEGVPGVPAPECRMECRPRDPARSGPWTPRARVAGPADVRSGWTFQRHRDRLWMFRRRPLPPPPLAHSEGAERHEDD